MLLQNQLVLLIPHNMIKATFDAFSSMYSPRNVANKRGRKVSEIFGNQLKSDETQMLMLVRKQNVK